MTRKQEIAIDANIVIYAAGGSSKKRTPQDDDLTAAARDLIGRAAKLYVSALAAAEVYRGLRVADANAVARLFRAIETVPLDAPAVERANELMVKRKLAGVKSCPRCLVASDATACSLCGTMRAKGDAWHDALIVASIEKCPNVSTFYTNDGGIVSMSEHVDPQNCRIIRLPSKDGALFDRRLHATPPKPT